MSEEAVRRLMEKEGWNPGHLKGMPLPDLKQALAEFWVKRQEEEEQRAVGGEDRHADESVDVDEKNESLEIVRMKLKLKKRKLLWRKRGCRWRKRECSWIRGDYKRNLT